MSQDDRIGLEALRRWRVELEAWAIPEEILSRAPESPWGFPVELFGARAAQAQSRQPTPSTREALRWLPAGGAVLDVGAGGGAASLPLAGRAGHLVAVDPLPEMLEAFAAAARKAGIATDTVRGNWPDVAGEVAPADVVVCTDVLYNVPDLAPFALALTSRARARVVVQLTARHPLASLGPLWLRLHGLERPEGPTADDAVAALRALGLQVERENWTTTQAGAFERFEDLVAFSRRRLCLPAERDPEIAEALRPLSVHDDTGYRVAPLRRPIVTLSWPGTAAEPQP
jgi:SAM-dependent methyltransferase